MNTATPLERIAASHAALAPGLPGGARWLQRRSSALATLVARGLPERRDENWKYLDHLRLGDFRFDAGERGRLTAGELRAAALPTAGSRQLVMVDGRFDAGLSDLAPEPGLVIEDIAALLARDPASAESLLRAPAADADERFALLADAFTGGGLVIRVVAGRRLDRPLCLLHVATSNGSPAHHSRIVIEAGAGACLRLVEEYISVGGAAVFGNLSAELNLASASDLDHLRLLRRNPAAAQVETWVTRLAAGATYRQHLLVLGGGLVRSDLRLTLEGEAADCRLSGLYLADGQRQVDIHTQVTHQAPRTRTVQDYRGIATDRGRGAFNGRIAVNAGAPGADASQTSRNLLLSPGAEINARPQLEIHVDDVRCRHGATTGTLDPAQLFYLLSRGLDPATARNLLTYAFCQDIIAGITHPALRAFVEDRIAGALPERELIRGLA